MLYKTLEKQGFKPGDKIRCVKSDYTNGMKIVRGYEDVVTKHNSSGRLQLKNINSIGYLATWELVPKTWGEMTDEEKGALLLAHHDGKTVQYLNSDEWYTKVSFAFNEDKKYRIKPKPVKRVVDLMADHKVIGKITLVDGAADFSTISKDKI